MASSAAFPHATLLQKFTKYSENSRFCTCSCRRLPALSARGRFPFRFQARSSAVTADNQDQIIEKGIAQKWGTEICKDSCVQSLNLVEPQRDALKFDLFACPVCYEPLIRKGPPGLNLPAIYRSGFKCQRCNKSFSSKDVFLDLTVTAGTKNYNEFKPARTELFRSPLVSFLYERGWRQNFNRSGFPGPDEEFKMAQAYFKPAAGGLLVDVSCGSGLFSRKFVNSGVYSGVVALDFSENMLRQCYDFISKDISLTNVNIALVRADVSRLPFSSGSVDAVHAGAALHCWPSPSDAVAEISRILRSGGVFVGTTFLAPAFGDSVPYDMFRSLRQNISTLTNSYNNLTEREIQELCKVCGLVNYTSDVRRSFIMFSAQKP